MKWFKKLVSFFYLRSDIGIAGNTYMKRWKLMPEWLPGVRIHHIVRSDDARAQHDHPFHFLSIILKGGYWEYLADGNKTWHGPGSVLWRPATTLHRIELPWADHDGSPQPAWTLVFRSRYFRNWGFMTKNGWVHNSQFITKVDGHHFDTGEAK